MRTQPIVPSAARVTDTPEPGAGMINPAIPLLTLAPGPNAVPLDLKQLVRTRLLIQASSGGGKSRALRYLLEQTHGHLPHLVIDPEGEYASLREQFPYVLVGQDGDLPAEPAHAALLCRRLVELGASTIIDLYDLQPADRRRYAHAFLEALMRLPRELWRPLLVVIDEIHTFAPERGAGEAASTEAVIALATQGRKRGFALLEPIRITRYTYGYEYSNNLSTLARAHAQ
jgi:DNA helicase HerA-like ATPase